VLVTHYRVSLVLSTATQPELTKTRARFGENPLRGLGEARELAPDPHRLCLELDRVTVSLPESPQDRRDWDAVARELGEHERVLCIVNRRDDAEALWRKLPPGANHLSARMCGAHRASAIVRIKSELAGSGPVRVISTQLVEAGVDLDFPVVYRAMAGLDSIAQAAGRCNREGLLGAKGGRVVVFNPPRPSPSGLLLKAEQAAQSVLAGSSGEPLTRENYARYFDLFYADVNSHDKAGMADLLANGALNGKIQFRTAAMRFRLIPDEGQRAVFVRWGEGAMLIKRLQTEGPHRDLMRSLQRHAVTLHDRQWKELLARGDLELHDNFLIQRSEALYHPQLGLLPEVPDYDPKGLVASREDT
jgi:CRISPR-associated endonuclease/helicase Cas3